MTLSQLLTSNSQSVLSLLTLTNVTLLSLSALALWWAVSTTRQYFRLRHIPGPPLAGFSILWIVRRAIAGTLHLELGNVCQKYSHIVRVGPNSIVSDDPEVMKRTMGVRSDYVRSGWYRSFRLHPDRENVVSTLDEALHTQMRAKLAMGYSGKEVDDLEGKVDSNILTLMDLIQTRYVAKNKSFDMARKIQYFTLDVLSDTGFSERFGYMDTDSDRFGYIAMSEAAFPVIFVLNSFPWIVKLLWSPLFKRIQPSENDATGLGRLMGVTNKVVSTRYPPLQTPTPTRDMLDSFVSHGLTQSEAESESMLQVVAGSDTSAGAIRFILLYILTNPRVLASLRHEIDTHKPSWPVITDAEARGMPYLQAVILEGLRMSPPITGMLVKTAPVGGDTVGGVWIPGSTEVGVSWYGMMRREDIWGEDAEVFRPERFLEAAPERRREMEAVADMNFGYGRFRCLGRPLAFLEMNKIFIELLRRFDLAIVNPQKPWTLHNQGLSLIKDFWIRAYARDVKGS